MKHEDKLNKLIQIKKQFLCTVPLKEFQWKDLLSDNLEIQQEILLNTVDSDLILKKPIKTSYQKAFIKCIITVLEKQGSVIDDKVYEAYGRLVSLPATNTYFKHYLVNENNNKIVSLKENVNIISNGTTGLCTWEASLALSEWILQNKHFLNNKTILELGSGIGLVGLIITLHCSPNKLYLTDCHSSVLKALCDNIRLNCNFHSNQTVINNKKRNICLLNEIFNNKCNVQVLNLPWENITNLFLTEEIGRVHKIIAADIVYDRELFPSLISAVNCLFDSCFIENFLLACTERNQETLDEFLLLLGNEKYRIEEVTVPVQNNFIWSKDARIRIFDLSRN